MWHVSIRDRDLARAAKLAYGELDGVGDASLGEWVEAVTAFHLRRRLSKQEELLVGPVVDIRGTPEAWRRFKAVPARARKLVGEPL